MSVFNGILLIDPSDSAGSGLAEWEALDPAALVSGTPVQRGRIDHEIPDAGYLAGVWDCTAFVDQPGPYPVDEFMYLLEGSVVMAMPDGSEVVVKAGEAFIIPKGLDCQWKMPEYTRKIFMILDLPVAEDAANPSLTRVTVPDLAAPVAQGGAVEQSRVDFVSSNGRMRVTLRAPAAGRSAPAKAHAHLLVRVLSGGMTALQGGATQAFAAGDAFYLHAGTETGWEIAPGTRLLEASYEAV